MRLVSRTWRDVVLVWAALVFASPSLIYPLGHDQAVHFYVGRSWLEGGVPYRDAFDYKPPGIYAVHALAIALFGEAEWPIRVADLIAVAALAIGIWLLLSRRPRGSFGLTCLATSIAYYGFFNFWDTAQCEAWSTAFAVLALASARRERPLLAGLAMGCAIVMKTPAALFVPVVIAFCPRPRWTAVRFLPAAGAIPIAVVLWFAAHGALGPMRDALGGATYAYVLGARQVDSFGTFWRESVCVFEWFNPYATLALAACAMALLRASTEKTVVPLRRFALPLACAVAAFVGLACQLKFYRYHWVPMIPSLVLTLGEIVLDIGERVPGRAAAVVVTALVAAYAITGKPSRWWWIAQGDLVEVARGRSRDEVLARQAVPEQSYDRGEIGRVAAWISSHTAANDVVLVRGFHPEIYALSKRRSASRFFWTLPLTDRARSYRTDEWRAVDRAEIVETRPHWIVAVGNVHDGIDSAEYFQAMGYVTETTMGHFVVLRRGPMTDAISAH